MLGMLPIFASSLFLSLNFGVLLYIKSTILSGFFSESSVGLVFVGSALFNATLLFLAPRLLRTFGKELLMLLFVLIAGVGTWGIFAAETALIAVVSLITYESFLFMAYWCLDIFLEEKSKNAHTGEIRGIYFAFINIGIAIGPLFVSLLSDGDDLSRIYFSAAIFLVIPLTLGLWGLAVGSKWVPEHRKKLLLPFRAWWKDRSVRAVTMVKLVLESFYTIMVIYIPLYLHGHLGFAWSELGIIFTVALLPLVIFEWPAGLLSDRYLGEKEIMSLGLFVMGCTLLAMPFLEQSFFPWMAVLFLSRVGASFVEAMTESYFFKKISADNTGLLSIFRLARPTSILLGSIIGVATLSFFSFGTLFFVLAIFVFWGLYESLHLKDTL